MASKKMLVVAAVVVISGITLSAGATPVTVPGYSFETPVAPAGGALMPVVPDDWTGDAVSAHGIFNKDYGNAFPNWSSGPADGNQYAYLYSSNVVRSLTTTNAVATIQGGTDYTLTVALGNMNGATNTGYYPETYVLELLANDVSVASFTLYDASSAIAANTFADYSVMLDAATITSLGLVGQNLKIYIAHINKTESGGSTSHKMGVLDNVRLDATAVPEPATMAMLGLGGVMMLIRRQRTVA